MFKKTLLATAMISLSFSQVGHASKIGNNITGVGPKENLTHPVLCLQESGHPADQPPVVHSDCKLEKGKFADAAKCSVNNKYYVGGAIRFSGQGKIDPVTGKEDVCDPNNIYLGYVGFSIWPDEDKKDAVFQEYQVPQEIHITLDKPHLNTKGELEGDLLYTAILPNFNLPKARAAHETANWDFVGVNLSGLEFSKAINPYTVPNLSEVDAKDAKAKVNSDLEEVTLFIKSGMNTFRVPISWGFLQLEGPGKGDLNLNYYHSYVKPLLQSLTKAGVYTMVDLHSYMRFSKFGKEFSGCADSKLYPSEPCPGGSLVKDPAQFVDVWSKLYDLIKADKDIDTKYIMFDLMNEPTYDKPEERNQVPSDFVFTVQAKIIEALRKKEFDGYILVEGSKWTGLHSWNETWTSTLDGKTVSNAMLFSRENFAKAGITDLSKIIINVHQYLDSNFSGTHDECRSDLDSVGEGEKGFNLQAFAGWLEENKIKAMVTEFGSGRNESSCKPVLNAFFKYLQDNASKDKEGKDKGYGFIGWTAWSAGHGWGKKYELRITPDSYHMTVIKDYLK